VIAEAEGDRAGEELAADDRRRFGSALSDEDWRA